MPSGDLGERLIAAFSWLPNGAADVSGWWRDPALLRALVEDMARQVPTDSTLVASVASRGFLLGPLVAQHLGLGFVEVPKDLKADGGNGDGLLRRATPPDYAGRSFMLAVRRELLRPRDRVALVDWIATGAQAIAARGLIEDAEAELSAVCVIVDDTSAALRRSLGVRSVLRVAQLEHAV